MLNDKSILVTGGTGSFGKAFVRTVLETKSELIDQLTDEQREVLWLGRDFALDPKYAKERERELGRVRWSTVS